MLKSATVGVSGATKMSEIRSIFVLRGLCSLLMRMKKKCTKKMTQSGGGRGMKLCKGNRNKQKGNQRRLRPLAFEIIKSNDH